MGGEYNATIANIDQGTYTTEIWDAINNRSFTLAQTTFTVDQKHIVSIELEDFAKPFSDYIATTDDDNLILKTTVDGVQKNLPEGYGIGAVTLNDNNTVEGFAVESLGNGEYSIKTNLEACHYGIYVYKGANSFTQDISYLGLYVVNLAPAIITPQPFVEGMEKIIVYANSTTKISGQKVVMFPYSVKVEKNGDPLDPGADTYTVIGGSGTVTFPSPKTGNYKVSFIDQYNGNRVLETLKFTVYGELGLDLEENPLVAQEDLGDAYVATTNDDLIFQVRHWGIQTDLSIENFPGKNYKIFAIQFTNFFFPLPAVEVNVQSLGEGRYKAAKNSLGSGSYIFFIGESTQDVPSATNEVSVWIVDINPSITKVYPVDPALKNKIIINPNVSMTGYENVP